MIKDGEKGRSGKRFSGGRSEEDMEKDGNSIVREGKKEMHKNREDKRKKNGGVEGKVR